MKPAHTIQYGALKIRSSGITREIQAICRGTSNIRIEICLGTCYQRKKTLGKLDQINHSTYGKRENPGEN